MTEVDHRIDKYHCARDKKYSLCGKLLWEKHLPLVYDPIKVWMRRAASEVYGYTKCPDCVNHPDLPLLVLGALDD